MSVLVTTTTTRGPAKWAAVGMVGGASLVGLAWAITARLPGPVAVSPATPTTAAVAPPVIIVQMPPAAEPAPSEAALAGPAPVLGPMTASAPIQTPPIVVQPAVPAVMPAPEAVHDAPVGVKRININTATAEELDLLPGVGKATAQAIIEHRTKHGRFRTVSDLDKVAGIGPSRIEKLRPLVSVE